MFPKKYFIITYGCQMNVHESEKLAGMLQSRQFIETANKDDADLIIFNTCCIRESAVDRAMGNIGAFKPVKLKNKNLIIAVGGCMTQQDGMAEKLMKKFPFIDIVFGTQNLDSFGELLDKRLLLNKKVSNIITSAPLPKEDISFFRTSGTNAYVNITYGCNNFCTYCIVPYVRGKERSRAEIDILNEIKKLVEQGTYRYITLLGQNVNSYGNDLENGENFPDLLKKICKINGNFKIKFMTSHPKDFSDELINIIATEEKMCKTIHLPVQSGSSKVLKDMNRKYSREDYLLLVDKIKKSIPNATLSSDFIVGFPGETEADFEETISLINTVKFDLIFAYMFSKRKGTIAEKMDNQIDIATKRLRVNKLLKLEDVLKAEKLNSSIGRIYNCLCTKILNDGAEFTADSGRVIIVKNCFNNIKLNEFYNVKITQISNKKVLGEQI